MDSTRGNLASHELRDESVSDLVMQLSEQTSTLVRQEMRLARAGLHEKGKRTVKAGARR